MLYNHIGSQSLYNSGNKTKTKAKFNSDKIQKDTIEIRQKAKKQNANMTK